MFLKIFLFGFVLHFVALQGIHPNKVQRFHEILNELRDIISDGIKLLIRIL
jgi:hypothetical protein